MVDTNEIWESDVMVSEDEDEESGWRTHLVHFVYVTVSTKAIRVGGKIQLIRITKCLQLYDWRYK